MLLVRLVLIAKYVRWVENSGLASKGYILYSFSINKTDWFDFKNTGTSTPSLREENSFETSKREWTVYPKICNVMTTKTKEYFV